MQSVNELLTQRLKKSDRAPKMAALAEKSASGQLTGLAGLFQLSELNASEKNVLENILKEHQQEGSEFEKQDLETLIFLTAEVKAISNQAALLHGERIKKAQLLLKKYRDGAFTAWLIACYGNRQTPYNLLQYYEFYQLLPKLLKGKIEKMPRQAVYALASREGPLEAKHKLVENYQGETKAELLTLIRERFPLNSDDKRNKSPYEKVIRELRWIKAFLVSKGKKLTKTQKQTLLELINEMRSYVRES